MFENTMNEIQQKNEHYKNEIRKRMKTDCIKKIRNEFLRAEQTDKYYQDKSKYSINYLEYLLNQSSNSVNLALINRIIIDKRDEITQTFIHIHLINCQLSTLIRKIQLNDLIALFGNLLVCENYRTVTLQLLNFPQITLKMINLINQTNIQTSSLILWILFQITLICPLGSIQYIAAIQQDLQNKIGLSDVNLSYLMLSISEMYQNLIEPQIIQAYAMVSIHKNTQVYFCQNIALIFDIFLRQNKLLSITQIILNWIFHNLPSQQFPPLAKTQIFLLLHNLLQNSLQQNTLLNLINEGPIITELIQRSLFDSNSQNKITCIKCIIVLIKKCTTINVRQLVTNYPTIIQVLVQSITLFDLQFAINILSALACVILSVPQNNQIKQIIVNSKLKYELRILSMSKQPKIAELANSILDEYLNQ